MFNSIKSLIGGKSSTGFLVSPEQIKYTVLQSAINKGDLESGRWLNSVTIFQKTPIFLGLQQHFVDGVAWDRTDYHDLIKGGFLRQRVEKFGGGLDAYYDYYDRLFEYFETADAKAILKLPPVTVLGGKGADLVRFDGNHRLSFALILQKPQIRARYKYCHPEHLQQKQS